MDFNLIRKGRKIQWTKEQEQYILDQYINSNVSMAKLGRDFSCDVDAIKRVLRENEVHIKSRQERYTRDSNFFRDINTQEKAYWLGFFYADGCVASATATHPTLIELSSKDSEHLEKFKKAIKAVNHKVSKSYGNGCEFYQFNIQDTQLHNDLIAHGCIPQKSKLLTSLPNIPNKFLGDFLRGYFDGDGSLSYDKSRDVYRISFVSGSLAFMKDLRKTLEVERLAISNSEVYYLSIVARQDVHRILDMMYVNSNEQIQLNRKYNTYQKYLAWYNNKEGL